MHFKTAATAVVPTALLCQVHGLLYSSNWDTRTAAAATIGLMAEAFPHHSVQELAAAGAGSQAADAQQQQQLAELQRAGVNITLQNFDLAAVLSKGEPLLASGGQVCGCVIVCNAGWLPKEHLRGVVLGGQRAAH